MKKIRKSVGILLLSFMLMTSLTACGSSGSDRGTADTTPSASEGTQSTQNRETMTDEGTGGVIDGLVNDMERGAEAITGDEKNSSQAPVDGNR